jgi:nucleotide-binding universal stress UspA family protein
MLTAGLGLVLAVALLLHLVVLGSEARSGKQAWDSAPLERGLIALAVESWNPGDALLLVNFPRAMDDDKDHVDPVYALIPMNQQLTFALPDVPLLREAGAGDPNWGHPIQFEEGRWLYTFTDFKEGHVDAIADTTLAAGKRVIVAIYDTQWGEREVEEVRAWALRRGEPGRRAPGQLMFVLDP